jgi:hypothetical protein
LKYATLTSDFCYLLSSFVRILWKIHPIAAMLEKRSLAGETEAGGRTNPLKELPAGLGIGLK